MNEKSGFLCIDSRDEKSWNFEKSDFLGHGRVLRDSQLLALLVAIAVWNSWAKKVKEYGFFAILVIRWAFHSLHVRKTKRRNCACAVVEI